MNFRHFLAESDDHMADVRRTLAKIPAGHRALVRGYKFVFQGGPTLKGDRGHVGMVDDAARAITLASPWNFGKETTLLHEIGHLVWKHVVTGPLKKRWSVIVRGTKNRVRDNDEETFAMAYASAYSAHPPATHYHKAWAEFVRRLPTEPAGKE